MKAASPIRKETDIAKLKKYLYGNKRDYFFFILGINTGLRAGDLLKLRVGDIRNKEVGEDLYLKEEKTGKQNFFRINKAIYKAFQEYLDEIKPEDNDFIFFSRKGDRQEKHLHIFSMSRIVSKWFEDLNIKGNYGTHSLRKTWGYHQRVRFGVEWSLICKRYNHSNPSITMRYLGITDTEVYNICNNEL